MWKAARTITAVLLTKAIVAYIDPSRLWPKATAAVVSLPDAVRPAEDLDEDGSSAGSPTERCGAAEVEEVEVEMIEDQGWERNDSYPVELSSLILGQSLPPPRRKSAKEDCQATLGPRDDPDFADWVRPCGSFSSRCTDIPLVYANLDYPGGGAAGAVIPGQDYVVQFDIGIHPAVVRDILHHNFKEMESCVQCPSLEQIYNETCLETIVTGGAMWGNLGLRSLHAKAYDCMGSCGKGCSNIISNLPDDVGALDCLKHDVCSAWKSVLKGRATRGFCYDPDCGDEAAMSLFNCWKGWRLFGSIGGSRNGPFSIPAVCDPEDPTIAGCWSHGGWFTKGRCKVFQGWAKGQGIPDPHPLRSPIQRLR